MAKLSIGSPAPSFELQGTGSKTYRLGDYKGTGVILAFYPGDFTPVCTKQFCSYRDDGDRLEALGVPMLGISPQSVESHERFSEKHGLNVPLLSGAPMACWALGACCGERSS
jgi:peroxiredoxin Q/BCP